MSFSSQQYIPCIRWKQGEYQALYRLSSAAQALIVPLIEIPEIGYDFESRTDSKSIDKHLVAFAKRVKDKWGERPCLVDMHLINSSQHMNNGQHPFTFVFNDLRAKGVNAIPVVGFKATQDYLSVTKDIAAVDRRGLCIRIHIEDVAQNNLAASLEGLFRRCGIGANQCDLIVDLEEPSFEPIIGFGSLLNNLIMDLPYLAQWRSFALIGTSFPSSMGGLPKGLSLIFRNEWLLYKLLVGRLNASHVRIPAFGDYGINHPARLPVDMRKLKPSASVRYTIDDGWLIIKGPNVRDNGFGQYRQLCKEVIKSKHYCGRTYSYGDEYIHDCARGAVSTGNLTTWRCVGTNHHLEKVTRDVANRFAL